MEQNSVDPLGQALIAEAIFVCEFHDKVGNAVIYCYPEDEIKKDFDQIQDFVIPKDELCGKLIIIEFRKDFYVLGLPILLRNKEKEKIYDREKYIFNVCIMVRKDQYLQRKFWYQEITRKLAFFFTSLEIETHYIYMNSTSMDTISDKVQQLYFSLNKDKDCFLEYNEDQYIFIKYIDAIKQSSPEEQASEVKDYMVPISLLSSKALDDILEQFDSELYRVYKEINGEKCVKKISRDLSKDLVKLKMCLKNLYFHKVIQFVDIFRLQNRYQVTSKIHDFMANTELQELCARYISVNPKKPIEKSDLVMLYLQLQKNKAIIEIALSNKAKFEKINLVQFVQFGIIHEFVERVHKYCLVNREIDLFSDKNIDLIPIQSELRQSKRNNNKMMQIHELITKANSEFNKLIRSNSPLDQILVEFQITEEAFMKISEISSIATIHK